MTTFNLIGRDLIKRAKQRAKRDLQLLQAKPKTVNKWGGLRGDFQGSTEEKQVKII